MKNSTKALALILLLIITITWYVKQNQDEAPPIEAELASFSYDEPFAHTEQPQDLDAIPTVQDLDESYEEEISLYNDVSDEELDLQDEYGMTPLLQAIDANQPKAALSLLTRGANPNLRDKNGTHPFVAAIVMGEPELVAQFLTKDIDPNMPMDLIATTPLMIAALENQLELVKILVNAGASLDQQNQEGTTALMMAADMGNIQVVDYFIQSQADKSLKDQSGMLAADFAQRRGLMELARSLRP
jgi:ankyrin repeat protein